MKQFRFVKPPESWSAGQAWTTILSGPRPAGPGEPSDIVWHSLLNRWFFVDDGAPVGRVCSCRLDGSDFRASIIISGGPRDLEGICIPYPANGLIYVLAETQQTIYELSANSVGLGNTITALRTWSIAGLVPINGGAGPEGITFVPVPGHPEGGLFWVASQADGRAHVLELKIRTSVIDQTVRKIRTVGPFLGQMDVASIHCDQESAFVLWLYDAANRILVTDSTGNYICDFPEPHSGGYRAWEGVCIGPNGSLGLADDGGVVAFIPFGGLGYGPVKVSFLRQVTYKAAMMIGLR